MTPLLAAAAVTAAAVLLGALLGRGVICYHQWAWRMDRTCDLRGCEERRAPRARFCSGEHRLAHEGQWDRDHFYVA